MRYFFLRRPHRVTDQLTDCNVLAAKNLVLAGVRTVAVHDSDVVSVSDLGANFYLSEADIGSNRAEVCRAKLADLNGAVAVECHSAQLEREFLATFNIVVLCGGHSLQERVRVADTCHELGVGLVMAETCGLAGMLFVDFGSNFEVIDKDGELPKSSMIACIDQVC